MYNTFSMLWKKYYTRELSSPKRSLPVPMNVEEQVTVLVNLLTQQTRCSDFWTFQKLKNSLEKLEISFIMHSRMCIHAYAYRHGCNYKTYLVLFYSWRKVDPIHSSFKRGCARELMGPNFVCMYADKVSISM